MADRELDLTKLLYPGVGALIALSTLFGIAIRPKLVLAGNAMVGKPAPEMTLPVAANTGGATAGSSSINIADLKGHAVLLDFWASWCGPCAMEAPVVDRLARRFEKRGLVVVGVNVSDTPETVKAYAAQKGLSYPMVLDPANRSQAAYGVTQLPSLVLIDKEGKVQAFLTGVVDEAALSDVVSAVL